MHLICMNINISAFIFFLLTKWFLLLSQFWLHTTGWWRLPVPTGSVSNFLTCLSKCLDFSQISLSLSDLVFLLLISFHPFHPHQCLNSPNVNLDPPRSRCHIGIRDGRALSGDTAMMDGVLELVGRPSDYAAAPVLWKGGGRIDEEEPHTTEVLKVLARPMDHPWAKIACGNILY